MFFKIANLFKKKTIGLEKFNQQFLWPFLDDLNEKVTTEILSSLKKESIEINKVKEEVEVDVALWLEHIAGKVLGQIKIFEDSFSPELFVYSQSQLEYLYKRWGQNKDHDEFISRIRAEYINKTKGYQKWEIAYSKSEISFNDFEMCMAATLLNINYKEFTNNFIVSMQAIHKHVTLSVYEFFKIFSKRFKISISNNIKDEEARKYMDLNNKTNELSETPEEFKKRASDRARHLADNLNYWTSKEEPEEPTNELNFQAGTSKDRSIMITKILANKKTSKQINQKNSQMNYTKVPQEESPEQFKKRVDKLTKNLVDNLNRNTRE